MNMTRKNEALLPPLREKVDQYSYLSKESIGKGYSSSVYKGRDDKTGKNFFIQTSKWL